MSKSTRKFTPSKIRSVEIARSWLELGIKPVPLHPQSKKPKGGKGWNTLIAKEDTLEHYFEDGDNVGGLWGEPSGWIVDVDLDWEESAAIAPYLLPETFIYGRHSRPRTHYLYRCEGITTSKRVIKKEDENGNPAPEVVVEIRSTGSQSVLPPSVHPDRERYQIDEDRPFKTISRRHLDQCVNQVAAATILARYYPDSGGRHDYIHAITGALLWGGWEEDRVRNFLAAILDAVRNKEDDASQRQRTIENTIEHFRQGNRVYGWKTLSSWLNGDLLTTIRKWLNTKGEGSELPDDFRIPPPKEDEKIDPDLLKVPGLVGKIAQWSAGRSYLKQPVFDLAVGLMCTAVATGNKYVIDGWDTPLQPYFMLVAPTAGGKESALENTYSFLRRIGYHDYAFQGFQSYHSMLDRIGSPPNIACWLWDEAARRVKTAARSTGSQEYQVLTWLLSLYGRANSFSPGIPGRHNAIPAIDHPFLTVLATAQPTQMMEAITDSDLATGLVNRFILFDVGDILPEPNMQRQNTFPANVEEIINRMKSVQRPSGEDSFIRIKLETTKTWVMFRDFDHEARMNAFKGGTGDTWGRANQNALILAGIVAVGIEPKRPSITEELADWAIAFVRWSCSRWGMRVDDSASRSLVEHQSKAVERYIRYSGKFAHRAQSEKWQKAMKSGMMPRNILNRLCRHIRARDLEDVIQQLISSDLIGSGDYEGSEVLWAKNP